MEDSNAMTVEFLRARLLSERAVSKSARQRADELAKRVEELEEQLKFVSLQRRRAEKATADIVAILEENGYTEISEAFDSSSEHESLSETRADNDSTEAEENSVSSKAKKNEVDPEHDFSSASGRNLSWKGRKIEANSSGKDKESVMRRRSSFDTAYFSTPKHRQGKSCRQIRRRESRCVVESHKTDKTQKSEVANSAEVLPRTAEDRPFVFGEDSDLHTEKDGEKIRNSSCSENERDERVNMEKALEHQEQLIGHYEAMEKAQREWEAKFRENNTSMQDQCDLGNHSDVTEESEEIKMQAPQCSVSVVSLVQDVGSAPRCGVSVVSLVQDAGSAPQDTHFVEESSKAQLNSFFRRVEVSSGQSEHKELRTCNLESAVQDFSFSGGIGEHNPESLEIKDYLHPHSSEHYSYQRCPDETQSAPISSCDSDFSFSKGKGSWIQNSPDHPSCQLRPDETQAALTSSSNSDCTSSKGKVSGSQNEVVPLEKSIGCSGVLEALKQAKLSLQGKIGAAPLQKAGSTRQGIETSVVASKVNTGILPFSEPDSVRNVTGFSIPVGCSGLFRVPMDLSAEAFKCSLPSLGSQLASCYPDTAITLTPRDRLLSEAPKANFLSSGSQKGSVYHFHDSSTPSASSDRLPTTPYVGTLLSFPSEDVLAGARSFNRFTDSMPSASNSLGPGTSSVYPSNDLHLTSHYSDSQPRMSAEGMRFDPHPNSMSFYSNQQRYPAVPSYQNLMPPTREGFPTFYKNRSTGLPPTDQFSFQDHYFQPKDHYFQPNARGQ